MYDTIISLCGPSVKRYPLGLTPPGAPTHRSDHSRAPTRMPERDWTTTKSATSLRSSPASPQALRWSLALPGVRYILLARASSADPLVTAATELDDLDAFGRLSAHEEAAIAREVWREVPDLASCSPRPDRRRRYAPPIAMPLSPSGRSCRPPSSRRRSRPAPGRGGCRSRPSRSGCPCSST